MQINGNVIYNDFYFFYIHTLIFYLLVLLIKEKIASFKIQLQSQFIYYEKSLVFGTEIT